MTPFLRQHKRECRFNLRYEARAGLGSSDSVLRTELHEQRALHGRGGVSGRANDFRRQPRTAGFNPDSIVGLREKC